MDAQISHDLIERLHGLLDRVETHLPPQRTPRDDALAYRWVKTGRSGYLADIPHPQVIHLEQLLGIDQQKQELVRNTAQFVTGKPANNALLWGSRGTGKSSLIKALLGEFSDQGLRIIEVDRVDLCDLPDIVEPLRTSPHRYLIFSDDLSFEANDPSYKALKATIDGSLAAPPDNVLIYATSNRRHLLPEYLRENQESRLIDGEIHHGEAVEEKISLSERFGLWLAFHPFSQDQYLSIVSHYLVDFGIDEMTDSARSEALRWALSRGSRSGRVAWQFARDWAGRM